MRAEMAAGQYTLPPPVVVPSQENRGAIQFFTL